MIPGFTQYAQGEQVQVIASWDGQFVMVTGDIFKVMDLGHGLQHLTIYDKTAAGQGVNVKTYNDDSLLKKTSISEPVTA